MKWPKHKAGELFDIQLGKMLNEKARTGNMFPYLANFNVRWGKFDLTDLNQMAFSSREQEKFSIQPNDLLMCEGGEIGRCAVWMGSNFPIFYQKALHRLRPLDGRVTPHFMYYFMQYISTKGDLPKLVGETSIAHLTREKLVGLPIPVPPRAIQNKIVEVLLTWDAAIEKTERLISAKEKRFTSLIQMLISRYCEKWKQLQVQDIFEIVIEKKNGGQELLSVTQDQGVVPRSMLEGRVMSPAGDTASYKLIRKGDFAISLRSFQGGIEYSRYKGLISPAYSVLRPKMRIHNDFYRHFFKSYLFIEKYLSIAVIGIRDGKQISIPDFMTVKIPYPPIDKQEIIAAILNIAREEIELLKKQARSYKKQKFGLMQKLLTGEWPVTTPKEKAHG